MLNLVVTLLIIALIAAVLGFGGIAFAAVEIAKVVFFIAYCSSSLHSSSARSAGGDPLCEDRHSSAGLGQASCYGSGSP
jgi:uncharacterized membrane protein YtjA (UPF0391 family)